jgi:neutral ceramidase
MINPKMIKFFIQALLITFALTSLSFAKDACPDNTIFKIGTGKYDITGPAAEEGMMGYGMFAQQTAGILQRLWARAFIIESPCNGKRIVFVNTDLGMVFQGVQQQVIVKLKQKYGELYQDDNVLLTAIHTHSGPGGFSTHLFYNITTFGFSRANFNAIVNGIVKAIMTAHNNLADGTIKIASGDLENITYNRSPTSYLQNPETERAKYKADRDTEMTLIRFDNSANQPLGLINWFPIHGVSMNNKNLLINGDNKGYAEYLFEKDFANNNSQPFIAAFAQANAGDVSSNPLGQAGGTGLQGILDVEQAGNPQYKKAKELFNQAQEVINGDVDYRQMFVAMDTVSVLPEYTGGSVQQTCPAAIGVSMLAGTQDGEGIGKQGVTCSNINGSLPFGCELVTTRCQGVKPIVLQTGIMKPYPWTPNILPLQIFKIGQLIIVAAPFELTTMTGRRIREAVAKQFPSNYHVVISALSNAYSGYVATREEYEAQRYEAASTHFGPWTQPALVQEFTILAKALVNGEPVQSQILPPDLSDLQIDLQPGVIWDLPPLGKKFGDLAQDVAPSYKPGDTVTAIFWGAHPKNNFHNNPLDSTFLEIEYLASPKQWVIVRNDNDWDTEYHWTRKIGATSQVTINWRIPKDMPPGQYRIIHFGDAKTAFDGIVSYVGYSSVFTISQN